MTAARYGCAVAFDAKDGASERITPKPFLKWAGGKTRLLPTLTANLPSDWRRGVSPGAYVEPFLGGGALFFRLRPIYAVLGDSCSELVNAYSEVRDRVEDVISDLSALRAGHSRDQFHNVRKRTGGAERTIYLNKTRFNGLYRVNRKGEFNVPFGDYKDPNICDEAGLRVASEALAGTQLLCCDFEATMRYAKKGDLVYCDPPYPPASKTANFTSYTAEKFGPKEHERLRAAFGRLASVGAYGMLSIADVPLARELYASYANGEGLRLLEVEAPRAISCKGDGRQAARKLLVMNYDETGRILGSC